MRIFIPEDAHLSTLKIGIFKNEDAHLWRRRLASVKRKVGISWNEGAHLRTTLFRTNNRHDGTLLQTNVPDILHPAHPFPVGMNGVCL